MNKKMREIMADIDAANEEAKKLFEAKKIDETENKLNEIDDLKRELSIAEKLFKEEKETVDDAAVAKAGESDKIKNFVKGVKRVLNSMNEGTNTDGGYTITPDVQSDIEHLRESKASLVDLVTVENVTKNSGRRTYKKRSSLTGFAKTGEGASIGAKNTPQYDVIEYNIGKYVGIYPVTNELLDDSDADIYNEMITWIADESRVTRNQLIVKAINEKPKVELEDLDDIKKAVNVTLGQAFKPTSYVVTNDDGLNYLDTLKDSDGRYLLQPSPVDPMQMFLSVGATKIPLKAYPNADLTSEPVYTASVDTSVQAGKTYYTRSGSEGSYVYTVVAEPTGNPSTSSYYEVTSAKVPVIIGDLKEGIRLFDRRKVNILASTVAAAGDLNAFEEDLTLFRAIEREDVQVRDADAFVNGYIEISENATA